MDGDGTYRKAKAAKLPMRLQRRAKHAELARELKEALQELHLLTVTSNVVLEGMLRVPTNAPANAEQRQQDDKRYAYHERVLKEYAALVVDAREREIAAFARRFKV